MIIELTIGGSVIVAGYLGKYLKTTYDHHMLRKQYPKTITITVAKWDTVTLQYKSHEQLIIISAMYGDTDIRDWIMQNLDSDFLQFSVDDETLFRSQIETADDTKLTICYVLRCIV